MNAPRNTQPDEAARFLECLDPGAKFFTFQTFADDSREPHLVRVLHGTLAQHITELTRLNNAGAGIFVTVNATDGRGRTTANIERVRAQFVDLDGAPLEPVMAGELKPHFVVESSPQRWHAYWRVDDMPLQDFSGGQRALIDRFEADPNVTDLPRVMRLPGFYHRKGEAFMVRIISTSDTPAYAAAKFRRAEEPPRQPSEEKRDPPDLGMIKAALAAIDPDIDRTAWFNIGCALFNELGDDAGFAAWDEWSKLGKTYKAREMGKQWRSIVKKGYAYRFGTICHHADLANPQWREHRSEAPAAEPAPPPPPKCSLDEAHAVFKKWFGDEYDMDALNASAAAAASERLTGDPLWLLVISGPGAAKTETVQALMGCGAHVTSTIASEGALLSASPKRSRSKQATGGLLRKIGDRGVLVIKDVTSILSADRNTRGTVLAAVREIYDGRWERNVGTDGGQTLTWTGRIVVIGAVTTAWDSAHAVVAAMGDRFVLIRIDSNIGREQSGRRAIRNTGSEVQMRKELAAAMGGLVANACTDDVAISDDELELLLKAANIVTMGRTAVERDYRGEVVDAHAPEMPTRFAKQLTQMVRGGVAIGMTRERALKLALRCARDSMPPLRLAILLDVANNSDTGPGEVRKRINKPWSTIKREMEALHMLGMLSCDEQTSEEGEGEAKKTKTKWSYDLGDDVDRETLLSMGTMPLDEIPF